MSNNEAIRKLSGLLCFKGGVQINMSLGGVVVATRFTPTITGKGDTLPAAVKDLWPKLQEWASMNDDGYYAGQAKDLRNALA